MRAIPMLALLGLIGAGACGSSGGGGGSTSSGGAGGSGGGSGGGSSGGGGSGGGSSGGSSSSGGAGSSGGGSGGGLAAKDACQLNAAAFCERLLRCDGVNGLSEMGFVSVVDCTEHVKASSCTEGSDICGEGQTYNPDKAQACVSALKDLACSSKTSPPVCAEVCSGSPLGGGTITYQEACKTMVASACEKAFSCGPDSDLSVVATHYGSEAACVSDLQTSCSSAPACEAGETYHGDKAKQCVTEYAALSCTNLNADPAACEEICSTSPSGTGGLGGLTPTGVERSSREFCNQLYAAVCDRCFLELGISSVADCLSLLQDRCVEATESDICPSGTFRPDKGPACVNAVKTESCSEGLASPACEPESLCE